MMMKKLRCMYRVMTLLLCLLPVSTGILFGQERLTRGEANFILNTAGRYMANDNYEKALEILSSCDFDALLALGEYYADAGLQIRGLCNYALNNYDSAIDDFDKFLLFHPHDEEIHFFRLDCLFNLQRYEEAIQEADAILSSDEENYKAYNIRGATYLLTDKPEKAAEDFSNAILFGKMNNDFKNISIYYANRGVAYMQLHEYDKIIEDYTTILKMNPDDMNALLVRGVLYVCGGQYRKSIDDATKLIGLLDEDNYRGYFLRGYAYYLAGDYKKSAEDFSSVIGIYKKHAEAYVWRGYAYMHTGKNKSALKDLKQALKLRPNTYQCHEALGVFYLRQNEKDKARGYFEKAIELSPEHSQASRNILDDMDSMDAETAKNLFPDVTIPIESWGIFNLDNFRALMGGGL